MASACPRCGATKTESVHHGFVYDTFSMLGYRLRRCSSCNRWRVFKHSASTGRRVDEMTVDELREKFNQEIAKTLKKPPVVVEVSAGKMTQESQEKAAPVESSRKPGARHSEPDDEVDDYRLCPKCGSSNYHRSRRRWYEKLLKRRRMARCMRCNFRFPYPR